MSNHFVGKYEAEIKFRLPDPQTFLHQLMQDGAEPFTENNIETDYFFDSQTATLAEQNISMCVREMTPSGIKLWIVKGPSSSECKAINIDDCNHVKNMLITLGYQCNLTASKTRSIYFLKDVHITLDHLADIGWFAEFAIMTDDETLLDTLNQKLLSVAKNYGFDDELIEKHSYKHMFLEKKNKETVN
ncbi:MULTISPECIES: class IV adenylate cyclase [Providencia]|uniref:class IV adenylate cyclase n=1 Tax=Providencia TaxID=586 RepID=UPI00083850AB|nr:class IV adenylate cyclase [Providencia heimbachae]MBP6123237.1 class IV adenylate cyclase [Providencia sp.]NIH22469.1 class IV adenylate cyclase [Providencia heimbachae]